MKKIIIGAFILLLIFLLCWFFFGFTFGDRHRILKAWIIHSIIDTKIEKEVNPTIKQEVISYLEQNYFDKRKIYADQKNFVVFDFYGMSTKRKTVKVYGWCDMFGYRFIDNQIIFITGQGGPMMILLEKKENGGKAIAVENRIASIDYLEIFPKKLWHKIFGSIQERDSIFEIMEKWDKPIPIGTKYGLQDYLRDNMLNLIITFYKDRISDERFIEKQRPSNIEDPHKHKDSIYYYFNLKAPYEKLIIKSNPEKIIYGGGGDPIISPDGRYKAWIGVGQSNFLYFQDKGTGIVYEIINQTNDEQSELAWKDMHVLVFDQINGFEFGRHGVHIEFNVEKKEIIWAVPFGLLGFSKEIS